MYDRPEPDIEAGDLRFLCRVTESHFEGCEDDTEAEGIHDAGILAGQSYACEYPAGANRRRTLVFSKAKPFFVGQP